MSRDELEAYEEPAGELVLCAEPGRDEYSVRAPGYAPQHGRVQLGGNEPRLQVLRLEPEARIRGRLLLDGAPVAGAVVLVERARIPQPVGAIDPDGDWPFLDFAYDLDDFSGRPRTARSGADGRFELGELAEGTYRLEVESPRSAIRVVERLEVGAADTVELGQLELRRP